MQVVLPSAFSRLALSDPAALFDAPPEGVDGPALLRAMTTALRRVPEIPGLPLDDWRARVLVEAGWLLISDPRQRETAIHLTLNAIPEMADTSALACIRLIAMFRLGRQDDMIAEADRVLMLPSHRPAGRRAIRDVLRQWSLERYLPVRIDYLNDFWPNAASAVDDPFSDVRTDGLSPLIDRIGARLAQLNGRAPDDADFSRRLKWGTALHHRIFHLRRLVQLVEQKPAPHRTAAENCAIKLIQSFQKLVLPFDMEPLVKQIASGRSAMVTQGHAGLSTLHDGGLSRLQVPYSVIAHSVGPAFRPDDFHLATGGPHVAMEFAKLAKLMRAQPRVVRVFPDGGAGETSEIAVCGRPVHIGRGAAALAYLGKAATYFSGSHRNESGFAFILIPGPVATDYGDRESFERDFGAFYASCLEQIVLGPPEDMAPDGGFWPRLTN